MKNCPSCQKAESPRASEEPIPCKIHGDNFVDGCPYCMASRHPAVLLAAGEKLERRHAHAHAHEHEHDEEEEEAFSWTRRIVVPGVLFVAGLLFRHFQHAETGAPLYIFYAIMLSAYLLCGLPVLREAAEAVRDRDFFNEFTLMGLASLVAIFLGELSEAAGVMLFYSLGEAVQERAAGNSRRSIKSLLASKPETAAVLRDGKVAIAKPEEVAVGSRILVKPGDRVPLDGVVISGAAGMDMSSLTGESTPAPVAAGDKVFSGAVCLDGDLELETTAVSSDSAVGRILAMVENAVTAKSKTERFITVFARRYTPAVVTAALLTAVVPPLLFAQPWHVWVYRALVLLIVSCPCALVLSIPLAFFAGIGAASRHGLLVKGGFVFDALDKARDVVFDKTGTLTEGKLALSAVLPAPGVAPETTLRLAAIGESRANHPVAQAIVKAAGDAAAIPDGVNIKNVPGKGIVAAAPEGEILVGNAALLRERNVAFSEPESSDLVAHVALNGVYQGCVLLADRPKADSAQAAADLRKLGVRGLHMLTGDRPEAAAKVSAEVGLDSFRAGLLPEDKVKAFRDISPGGEAVFVGDGVNDAPLLAAAGVGVAMGGLGAGAAVEAADAVILDDSPSRLPRLFAIARKTRRIAAENIVLALVVKIAVMGLGVAGLSGLWEAVFADVGVALLAVLNSMRLTRI